MRNGEYAVLVDAILAHQLVVLRRDTRDVAAVVAPALTAVRRVRKRAHVVGRKARIVGEAHELGVRIPARVKRDQQGEGLRSIVAFGEHVQRGVGHLDLAPRGARCFEAAAGARLRAGRVAAPRGSERARRPTGASAPRTPSATARATAAAGVAGARGARTCRAGAGATRWSARARVGSPVLRSRRAGTTGSTPATPTSQPRICPSCACTGRKHVGRATKYMSAEDARDRQ